MKTARLALVIAAVAATGMIFTAESQAQRRGFSGFGGPGAIRGVPLAGAGRFGIGGRQFGRFGAFGRYGGYGAYGGFGGINFGNNGYYFARTIPRVFGDAILPYYALYPPVYYSAPVPRPYGFSPYALPPGMPPAEAMPVPAAEPELTVNPYFKPKNPPGNEDQPSDQQTVFKPQLIVNPYYVKKLTPEQSKKLAEAQEPSSNEVGLR